MIKHPPFKDQTPTAAFSEVFVEINQRCPDKLMEYMAFQRPVDEKGRYLHFDEMRYRVKPELNAEWVWAVLRFSRDKQLTPLVALGDPAATCQYLQTPAIQQALSMVDRYTSASALDLMSSKIGEKTQLNHYLINDLIEDEAISSSQLEGAATTTLVAKEMLKRKRKPRTPDEKMILGNFRMMQFAWEQRHQPLSIEFIADLHRIGVEGIDDNKYTPGRFRRTDDVVVIGKDDEIVHQPPPATALKERLRHYADWINTCHDDAESNAYIHTLIKAITLHFTIGYEHPFRDGNGRVARGLFYWFMFKHDYTAFRYIAISTLLKKAPIQYGKSYLYTETDGMDLTYFIDYQCRIIVRAIRGFLDTYQKIRRDIEAFDRWLWDSGLYRQLNDKQRMLFNIAKDDSDQHFTVRGVENNLGCSYNTAAAALNGLVDLGLFRKQKEGREWIYFLLDKHTIQKSWKS
ncbi:Fic family protein [Thiothrix sp.]|jgi:Fic family protein|uniref:Fic family protein n=1 Tax=Thiothrix sp. TaxID=1032 RepID=UPI00257C81E1|nr:Fic family protein [Thiothrix sp.]